MGRNILGFGVQASALFVMSACGNMDIAATSDAPIANPYKVAALIEDADWLPVPGVRGVTLMHRSCLHQVPPGGVYNKRDGTIMLDGKVVERVEKCRYAPRVSVPDLTGWTEALEIHPAPVGPSISDFDVQWSVPPAPQHFFQQQTIHIWDGLVDQNGTMVLQSVLSWTNNAHPGPVACFPSNNRQWFVNSWFVSGSQTNAVCGTPTLVNVGDAIEGHIDSPSHICDAAQGCLDMEAVVIDKTTGKTTGVAVGGLLALDVAFNVLETRNPQANGSEGPLGTDCKLLPNTTGMAFHDIYLYEVPPGGLTGGTNAGTEIAANSTASVWKKVPQQTGLTPASQIPGSSAAGSPGPCANQTAADCGCGYGCVFNQTNRGTTLEWNGQ